MKGNQKAFQGRATRPQHWATSIRGPLPEPCWCIKHWDIFSTSHLCKKSLLFWQVQNNCFYTSFVLWGLFSERICFSSRVAIPGSSAADARQWDCSTSLSAPVWEAYVASLWPLRSNTSNVSSSVSAPRLSNECKLLSQTNRLIHSRNSNCCFLLPYVLSLFQ